MAECPTTVGKRTPPLGEFMAERERADRDIPKMTIRIRVDNRFAAHMKWDRRFWGFVSERDCGPHTDMVFETRDFQEGFPRWLLMYGDGVQVLEPDAVRQRVGELIEAVAENFRK